jgi:hypothetical protein
MIWEQSMCRVFAVLACPVWIACAVLGGCAGNGSGRAPAWVEGTSPEFPADQYLVGMGQADSRTAAEQRAYAAVAKIFKVQVTAQSQDWETFLQFERRGTVNTERRLTLDHVTRVTTDKVLENVRILDAWADGGTGQHYALAGMNRAQAGVALEERIADLDGKVETELREFRQAPDTLTRLRNLRRAVKDLVLREAYNADLRVIRTSGRGRDAAYRVAELTAQLEQFLAANLVIEIEVTGEQAEPVRRAVMEGLIREGLPVSGRPAEPDRGPKSGEPFVTLLVKGTVRLRPSNVPDPRFKYIRWCSDFVIMEATTQRVVGAVSRTGREGHLSESEAMTKAIRVMQQELTSELARNLAGYVYGEADQLAVTAPAACPRGELPADERVSSIGPL